MKNEKKRKLNFSFQTQYKNKYIIISKLTLKK